MADTETILKAECKDEAETIADYVRGLDDARKHDLRMYIEGYRQGYEDRRLAV